MKPSANTLLSNLFVISPRMVLGWLAPFLVFCLVGIVAFLFAKRVVFPDVAFDSINYHFFLGESGFENFPRMFRSSEFFPLGMHSFNPLIDSINHIVYKLIGYRFGTILSVLTLIGAFVLSVGIVLRATGSRISAVAGVFLVPALVVNEGMFQVATYFTDNHYTFLVLGYVYILMGVDNSKSNAGFVLRAFALGILCGMLITKLTNVIYIIPLFLVTLYLALALVNKPAGGGDIKYRLLPAIFAFLVPVFVLAGIYFFDALMMTGNPIFPYYNGIFKSIYYPYDSWPFNFGPKTLSERLFYPYFVIVDPYRLGEVKDFFPDVKLITTLGFSVLVATVLFFSKIRLNQNEKILLLVTFGSYVIWQFMFGYSRYAIALEILLGLLVVVLINKLIAFRGRSYFLVFVFWYFIFSFWQSFTIIQFNSSYDIGKRSRNPIFP